MCKNVNYRLKALRVEKNLTQGEFGKILGMHEATYNRKEQGLGDFSLKEAKAISDFFLLPIEHIFFEKRV